MATKNLSRAELIKQRSAIDAAIRERYQEDLKALVNQFKEHLATGQFELADALAMLRAQPKGAGKRGASSSKSKGNGDKPVSGVTYRHPQTGEEWPAPANLRRVKKWLQELASAPGKTYADFAVRR